MTHKAGFVNIVGYPNAGKSTLMNLLMGDTLSVVTHKSQTTRHRILGILNDENYQIVFSDTPGIIKPAYKLQASMMEAVKTSFEDADLMIWLLDITAPKPPEDFIEKMKKLGMPLMILLNKVDLADKELIETWINYLEDLFAEAFILPVSALKGDEKEVILEQIKKTIPEHPAYFPKDQFTDKPERFFVSEIIRGKVLLLYKQEIPYSIETVVESFKEEEEIIRIRAVIFVNRKSQKPILIGKGGEAIKKTGTAARLDIEAFFGKKVYLELHVKVRENWRDNSQQLKNFGYNP